MYYPVQLGEASNEIYLASTIREIQVSECSDKGKVTQTTFADTAGVMTSSVLAWGYYCNDIPLHLFRSFWYESWSTWNVSCQSLGWIKSRLKELTWVMVSCLIAHPFTKGVSYVWANAKPIHEEGHRKQMVHDVRHLRYGAGGKKVVRRTAAM